MHINDSNLRRLAIHDLTQKAKSNFRFLISIKINEKIAQQFRDLGVPKFFQTAFVQETIVKKHEFQAEEVKRNPHQYNRHDVTGQKQADSGVLISDITQGKFGGTNDLMQSLRKFGFPLTSVYIKKKDGDDKSFLCLAFENVKDMSKEMKLKPEVQKLIKETGARFYEYMYCYMNPDNSCTVNLSKAFQHSSNDNEYKLLEISLNENKELAVELCQQSLVPVEK
ncbi:MAG: hypothetical protein RL641_49 [Candidatus Parcubacteria bacterium]|jgi:hypothetical protein